ncbi:MAG: tyrosine recombinase [Clostridia bacterium]|nr:tyrosine recombinase [Clostridia bacterium]
MNSYIDLFSDYLKSTKNASANTIESYIRDINQFIAYCTELNIINIDNVDCLTINNYIDYLTAFGKSDSTKSRIIASLRCYYRFLLHKKIVNTNPVESIKVKKSVRKLPGILDSNEIILLLSQPDLSEYKGIRDKAMLELLYATGIKVSELIELKVSDINLQVGIVHLHNDKKERIIPLYPAAIKTIASYLVNVRPAIVPEEEEDRLFTNMTGAPMSRQGFWKIIKHYAESAGIKKEITPHTLRHSFAAHLLENGAKLTDIKEMLGHSDISSTQVYAQLIKNKYTTTYSKFHPLAR